MPLSQEVLDAVLAEIAISGRDAVQSQVLDAAADVAAAVAKATLAPVITMSVMSWPEVEAFLAAGVASSLLIPLRDQIVAKIVARDETDLGELLMSFFGSAKTYLG